MENAGHCRIRLWHILPEIPQQVTTHHLVQSQRVSVVRPLLQPVHALLPLLLDVPSPGPLRKGRCCRQRIL